MKIDGKFELNINETEKPAHFWLRYFQVVVDGIVDGKPGRGIPVGAMHLSRDKAVEELPELRAEYPDAHVVMVETLFDMKEDGAAEEYLRFMSAIKAGAKWWRGAWRAPASTRVGPAVN